MRFSLQNTATGTTVFDAEVGECFKSMHSAGEESDVVFLQPGILEHPNFHPLKKFRILELGFGLGSNFSLLLQKNLAVEYVGIERDFSGLAFFLNASPNSDLEALYRNRSLIRGNVKARLIEADFFTALESLDEKFDCVFFDPFSPKANPDCWQEKLFHLSYQCLNPQGRLVTYSVSRAAKDMAVNAGFHIQKRNLPKGLQKRSSLLAIKGSPP
jgi:tRNA U34 5-methylaminomethyl-2-thiouridine-forming methyltransferase MnmC